MIIRSVLDQEYEERLAPARGILFGVFLSVLLIALVVGGIYASMARAAAWELPTLAGKHLGVFEGYERYPSPPLTPGWNAQQRAAVDAAIQQARTAG